MLLAPLIVPLGVIVNVVLLSPFERRAVCRLATADGKLRRTVAAGVAEVNESPVAKRCYRDTQGLTA